MECDPSNFFGDQYCQPSLVDQCFSMPSDDGHQLHQFQIQLDYNNVEEEMPPVKQRFQANARERCRTQRCGGQRFLLYSFPFLVHWLLILDVMPFNGLLLNNIRPFLLLSVNSAFQILRLLIPTEPKDRKLSKIETLRLAKSYINHLAATLTTGGQFKRRIY